MGLKCSFGAFSRSSEQYFGFEILKPLCLGKWLNWIINYHGKSASSQSKQQFFLSFNRGQGASTKALWTFHVLLRSDISWKFMLPSDSVWQMWPMCDSLKLALSCWPLTSALCLSALQVGVATQTQMTRITFRQHGTGKPGPDRAAGPGVRLAAQHATGLGHIRSLHPRDEPADGRRLRPLMCGGERFCYCVFN